MRACAAAAAALLFTVGAAAAADAPFAPPAPDAVPPGPLGDAVRYGEKVATQTAATVKANVGANVTCTSCHIKDARTPNASPWVGLWGVYPAYDARSGRVIALADRINECLRRSMNGKPKWLASARVQVRLSMAPISCRTSPNPLPSRWRSRASTITRSRRKCPRTRA